MMTKIIETKKDKGMETKGHHHFADFVNVNYETAYNGDAMVEVMAKAATEAGATVVHMHAVSLPCVGSTSPPGFTAVCLLDESHVTCHAYAEEGLLAFDAFTCGDGDKAKVLMSIIEAYVLKQSPQALTTLYKSIDRFHYNGV
jgi:S-adenosylmethionine decarboxylase